MSNYQGVSHRDPPYFGHRSYSATPIRAWTKVTKVTLEIRFGHGTPRHKLLEFVPRPLFEPGRTTRRRRTVPAQNTKSSIFLDTAFCILCWDPGSNWGPFALQANALPTELSQHMFISSAYFVYFHLNNLTTCVFHLLVPDIFEAKLLELSQYILQLQLFC